MRQVQRLWELLPFVPNIIYIGLKVTLFTLYGRNVNWRPSLAKEKIPIPADAHVLASSCMK
jgi:hypothetical protein